VTLFGSIDPDYSGFVYEQAANCPGRQFPSFSEFPRGVMLLHRGLLSDSDRMNAENLAYVH
jgi:hypothetical protein